MTGRPGAALANLRVLVVEDEMLVSLLIEQSLEDVSCVIVGPYDRLPGALAAAQSETVDLAVLDVNVAGAKVYPVAEALDARGVPFIFLTGYGQNAIPHDRPNWRVCGKPFRPESLLSMLEEVVGQR